MPKPRSVPPTFDLDLARLRDEDLVVLARERGYRPAAQALLLRYQPWSKEMIGRLAHRYHLGAADEDDAVQDSIFGILRAIDHYDTTQMARPAGCLFPVFLTRVLSDRFTDFLRHLWRHAREGARGVGGDRQLEFEDRAPGPARIAQNHEWNERLHALLSGVDRPTAQMLDGIMGGRHLHAIAAELGISYDQAKRRWRAVRAWLAERLENCAPGDRPVPLSPRNGPGRPGPAVASGSRRGRQIRSRACGTGRGIDPHIP